MGATLHLQCSSGISGDMTVAALLDLGASESNLRRALASLPLDGYTVKIGRVSKNGIDACDFDVVLDEGLENHDHDMGYLYGDGHAETAGHGHPHSHGHGHPHSHGHPHPHDHGHGGDVAGEHAHDHGHEHRTLADVVAIIDAADLTERARATATRIFEVLAEGEGVAHGVDPSQVHFHEVGAVDSIVDIVSVAVCLDDLDADRVVVERLCEGTGTVRCAHGIMPIPVPAVAAIVASHRIPMRVLDVEGELVTPTGAAIAAAVATDRSLPREFVIAHCGIGAGKRDHRGSSGVLRAFLIEESGHAADRVVKVECDVDDCDGEALGDAIGELLRAGALEAHCIATTAKKNRPAWQLQAICAQDRVEAVEAALFECTTTIGVRRSVMDRTVLRRRATSVETRFGAIDAKQVTLPSGATRTYPEHDSVAEAASRFSMPYLDVLAACRAACAERDGLA